MSNELAGPKAIQRVVWSCGDYGSAGELFGDVAGVVAEAAAIDPGMDVLDVATGTGDEAIPVDTGLPFADASCDRVLSTFGVMFAPRHEAAAAELVRTCRAGGMIVLANWTPDGFVGRIFETLGYLPTPSGPSPSPVMWGDEAHLRALLGGQVLLAMERRTVDVVFESLDAMVASCEERFGPLILARRALEPERYGALVAELRTLFEASDTGDDGKIRIPAEYLLVVGLKP